jgi:hypothetical protein
MTRQMILRIFSIIFDKNSQVLIPAGVNESTEAPVTPRAVG